MKKYIFLLMTTLLMTVFGSSPAWAQTTLVDFNFTDNEKFPTSTAFANNGETKMTVDNHDIYFYHNNTGRETYSLSSDGLQLSNNNMTSNYFVAIPLTGIKGEITVTFTHEYSSNKASYRYNIEDGATKYDTSGGDATTSVTDANNSDVTITKTFQVNSENAVFYFGRNGSNYTHIKGIKITTPETASNPKLTTFEFNNDDILYYYNKTDNTAAGRSAATSVSTTFEKNADYGENGYLRVKVNIEPDLSALTNPKFSIKSSKPEVLSTEGVTAYYKASDNRMYIDGVKVVGTGSATLTVTFNSSDNYDGTTETTSNTITVIAATAPTLSLTIPTSTTNAEIGSIIELTANKAFSLVENQYTTTNGVNYIEGKINENSVKFAVDLERRTLTYTFASGVTFAPNALYEIVIPAGKISSSGVQNTAQTFAFTTESLSTLTPVSEKLWDFEEADGFPASQIAETAVIDNMELVANSSKKMSFDNTAKSVDGHDFTRQLKFGGTFPSDGSYRVIHFKVAAGSTVNVWGSTGSSGNERSAAIRVATINGKFSDGVEKATLTSSTSDLVKGFFTIEAATYPNGAEVWVYSKNSGFNLSGIEVTTSKPKLTLSNSGQATSYVYSGSGEDSKNYEITYSYAGDTNLAAADASKFEVTSSDEAVIGASGVKITLDTNNKKFTISGLKVKQAGAATLTFKFEGNDTYAESSLSVPFTVTGKLPFSVSLEDLNIQQRQRRTIMPTITNASGNPIGFDASGNVVEMAADDDPVDYDTYFDFTYSLGSNDIGVTLEGNVLRAGNEVGGPVVVTVTANVKPQYAGKFTNSTASGTLNATVTERTTGMYFDFYLDKECTQKVSDVYSTDIDGSTTVVEDFPNGRVLYLKVNEAGIAQNVKEIWFSTGKNTTPVAVSRYVRDGEARTIYKDDPSKSQYLYKMDGGALPIYIDEEIASGDYVFVNVQCYKEVAGSYEQAGSVIPVKFNIVSHDRPANVTYDPSASGTERSTAQSVDAIGTPGNTPKNIVYGKFSSTSTNYTIEGLLNEPHVIVDEERTGVFSTEVGPRKISGVQIQSNYGDGGDYVGTMTSNNYQYLFATTLTLSQYEYNIDLDDAPTSIDEPTVTATYYDKVQKKDIDASSGDGITVTYSVANYNGANVSVVASTGEITLGSTSGYAIVTVNYENVNNITVNKRTSTMETASTTYVIYLKRSGEHLPKIEPASKKFYPEITVKVTADKDWDAYYIVKDVNETAPTGAEVVSGGTKVENNTYETFDLNATKIVYAVAYDGSSVYSNVISETYTRGEQVLPPYFVPDGITSAYTYYTETLGVEARTRTTGSVVYYTIEHGGSSPADPVIGASGTRRYDGLQGITLTEGGTYKIKAIAYKDGIQSTVVEATYIYSSIQPPYFDVKGSGHYTSGEHPVSTTDVITIGSNVVASTGTTLKHYYTLDGTDPGEDGGTLYTDGFTVLKTVTGKAYSVLVDASGYEVQQSSVTTVTFTVASALNVWEAVEETTPEGNMVADDGFIITRNADIISLYGSTGNTGNNSGTKVNLRSLTSSDATGGTASKTYAQADITVTFGGFDADEKRNWKSMTIADPAIGSPIDGVGTYNIAGQDNAKMEVTNSALADPSDNYNHMYSQLATTHDKTFHLPCKGAYVKFEPEKDGEVTIWALQHGSLNYQDGLTLCDKFIRYRPIYFIDEQGKSYTAKAIVSAARLSAEWEKIEATAAANSWTGWKEKQTIIHRGESMDVENKGLNVSESQAIYNLYKKYITDNNIKIGDPIKPFAVHNGTTISTNNGNYTDSSNDLTGYVMLTGGYVKYTFEVKAGKTYYFMGQGTKIGIRGFQFVPTENTNTAVEIDVTKTTYSVGVGGVEKNPAEAVTACAGKPANVTLKRAFNADQWTGLVLPFSVSTTQLEKVFGVGTPVIHFYNVTHEDIDYHLHFMKHTHQMIVAGTPVIIKPTQAVENPVFNGVQLEASEMTNMVDGTYTMMGTLIQGGQSLVANDYFFTKTGILKRWTGGNTAMKGTQAWLRPTDPSFAPMLVIGNMTGDDDETTGLFNIEIEDLTTGETYGLTNGVYDLRGRKVSEGSLSGLPKGVYIVNGKKIVVD